MREVEVIRNSTQGSCGFRFKPNRIVASNRKDLNQIWQQFAAGDFTIEELKEFYQLIGYTLYGYWEIFCFNNDERDSRRWTAEDEALMDKYAIRR